MSVLGFEMLQPEKEFASASNYQLPYEVQGDPTI